MQITFTNQVQGNYEMYLFHFCTCNASHLKSTKSYGRDMFNNHLAQNFFKKVLHTLRGGLRNQFIFQIY